MKCKRTTKLRETKLAAGLFNAPTNEGKQLNVTS